MVAGEFAREVPDYLLLGCGYTASRVARRLVDAGSSVVCTNRQKTAIGGADCVALEVGDERSVRELSRHLSEGMIVLHSIPTAEGTAELLAMLRPFRPRRLVYLSTTGVYGAGDYGSELVDERTMAAPDTERAGERLRTEQLVADGPWSSLVLRPAAIYGPHRGIHRSARSGVFRPPPGGNRIVSRIHVDDLAEHILAGLRSEISGAFPVADEEPCTSLAVAEWTLLCWVFHFCQANGRRRGKTRSGRRAAAWTVPPIGARSACRYDILLSARACRPVWRPRTQSSQPTPSRPVDARMGAAARLQPEIRRKISA